MSRLRRKYGNAYLLLEEILHQTIVTIIIILKLLRRKKGKTRKRIQPTERYGMIERFPDQYKHMDRLVNLSDYDCIVNLRMDRNTFARLCYLLRILGGLNDAKYVSVEEQVAIFLSILGHHKKNKVVKFDFLRSGQTISYYVHVVLRSLLKLHALILVNPTPITDNCTNPRWKWFKGCLGALDGTYIDVKVPLVDKARFRTRKGQISTNVLAVCDTDMRFVYVLPGWEGSAADSRVLRDALSRPHGLKVPKGNYYLCDNGYANSEGFLVPYRGVRYHVDEWGPSSSRPQTYQDHFNMRHTRARNVIERAFGVLKMRWGILRSATYYPLKTQIRLVMACFLIHNFIRSEMAVDPFEQLFDSQPASFEDRDENMDFVDNFDSSLEWNSRRDEMAQSMWAEWHYIG